MARQRTLVLSVVSVSLLWLLTLAAPIRAQEPLILKPAKILPVAGFSNTITQVPIRCDADGNLYVRGYQRQRTAAAPVVKISADGSNTTIFSLDRITDPDALRHGHITDYTVSPEGQVYMLVRQADSVYVVQFNNDGSFGTATKLQSGFYPLKLAVFPDKDFLVSGSLIQNIEKNPSGRAETAIFDRTGSIVKTLTLKGDVKLGASSKLPSGSHIAEQTKMAPGSQIALGTAIVGDDGNVYLLRRGAHPVVYVIDEGGKILRQLELKPAASGYTPETIKESAGTLAVEFDFYNSKEGVSDKFMYSLFNAENGQRIGDYQMAKEIRGNFACYTPNGFTFLGTANGRGRLVKVALR